MQDEFELNTPDEEGGSEPSAQRGPQGLDLPAQQEILREARAMIGNGDVRINSLADILAVDPILTLELLKIANATFYAADRPPITNVRTAVVRLGAETITEILDQVKQRPLLQPPPVALQFELLRTLSSQVSVVAHMISRYACRDLTELAQTAGLMSYVGHMVACAYLGERYLEVSSSKHYASLSYKLAQDYNFDVRAVQLAYLRSRGVPQDIFFALDRDMQCKTTSQASLRFTVQGATELVEAAHGGRWEKYSPYGPLPTKSALRLLKISEHQYEDLYLTVEDYLRKGVLQKPQEHGDDDDAPRSNKTPSDEFSIEPETKPASKDSHVTQVMSREATFLTHATGDIQDDSIQLSEPGKKVVMLIQDLCSKCKSTQDLLGAVMTLLISDGPYLRAALILVGNERQSASIHTAVGEGFDKNPEFALVDPLSPLALCMTKINSFNAQGLEDSLSPFGITSFAVSPIKVKNTTPVVLYADCGVDRSLPMEARKMFRLVVGLLNRILPSLPGGLPKKNYRRTPRKDSGEKFGETSAN